MHNPQPLFKYTGSKKKMFAKFEPFFSGAEKEGFETFVDLFGGTGVVSVWMHENYPNKRIILNEYNPDIYDIYHEIKFNYANFLKGVLALEAQYMSLPSVDERKKFYLKQRDFYHDSYKNLQVDLRTQILFFMMCTNFNGIWQPKSSTGIYYTPFGNGNEKLGIFNRKALKDFKSMVDAAEIYNLSYEFVPVPDSKCFIFADPPYLKSYTRYDKRAATFGISETTSLSQMLINNHLKGNIVALCNKSHPLLSLLFANRWGFSTERFNVKYTAASKDGAGAKATEVLIHNIDPTFIDPQPNGC